MALPLLSQPLSADRDYTITILDSTGAPATGYTEADTLSAVVWAGEDATPLFNPTVIWQTPSQGLALLTISAANTATLLPGTYRLRVDLTHAGRTFPVFDGLLELTGAPGVAPAPKVYCSYADMTAVAPWIGRLADETDLAGFAQERALARTWMDNLIQRHYRGATGAWDDTHFGFPIGGGAYFHRDGSHSALLQSWLDADALMLHPAIVRANVYHAIARVAGSQISPGKDSPYADLAAKYDSLAERMAALLTVSLDTNADGVPDVTVRLGVADTLEG
jgi:hypothetical protein